MLHLATLLYLGVALFVLNRRSRDFVSINGRFETLPEYQWLQSMLRAYALIALQSEFYSIDMYVTKDFHSAWTVHNLDLSHVLYDDTG